MDIIKILEENIWFEILFVMWIVYLWELYLSMRQRKVIKSCEVPPSFLEDSMPLDVYSKARNYALDKNTYFIYFELYTHIITSVFIITFGFYYVWQWSLHIIELCGMNRHDETLASVVCVFILNLLKGIIELPFKVYNTYVLDQSYGFNKQTTSPSVTNKVKDFVSLRLIALPILSGIATISLKKRNDQFFRSLWLWTIINSFCVNFLYPEFIAPFFEKLSPLPEGKLKQSIEALAASVDFPLYKLYIAKGSKRSTHSHAYMYGFYKYKRIVLFDTLVKGYDTSEDSDDKQDQEFEVDEIVGLLAHEIGHWKYHHTLKRLLLSHVEICSNYFEFKMLLNYSPMYAAFGFVEWWSQPVFIAIVGTMFIMILVNRLMDFLRIVNCRHSEFQADKFVKSLGYAEPLKRALVKLQKDNLSYPVCDSLYSEWHYRYPKLLERVKGLDKTD